MPPTANASRGSDVHFVLTRQIVSCLVNGEYNSVETILQDTVKTSPSADNLFRTLIQECLKHRAPKAAAWCLLRMVGLGVNPDMAMYQSTVHNCVKAGDYRFALELFHSLSRCAVRANDVTYNMLLNACAQTHDCTQAEILIHDMRTSGIPVSLVSFASIINAFAQVGNLAKVEEWYDDLVNSGLQADKVIFNSIMKACARAGCVDRATHWLKTMKQVGLSPDKKSYNCLINASARSGDLANAEAWMEEMVRQGHHVDQITFGTLLNACARSLNVDRAEYWMEVMIQHGLMPNVFCFNSLIQLCAQRGDYIRALKWFWLMEPFGVKPTCNTYNSIIQAYGSAHELTSAEVWLHRLVSAGFTVDHACYNTLRRAIGQMNGGEDFNDDRASVYAHYFVVKAYAKGCKLRKIQDHVRSINNMMVFRQLGSHFRKELADICQANGGEGFAHAVLNMLGLEADTVDSHCQTTGFAQTTRMDRVPAPSWGTFPDDKRRCVYQFKCPPLCHDDMLPFGVDRVSVGSQSTSSDSAPPKKGDSSVGSTRALSGSAKKVVLRDAHTQEWKQASSDVGSPPPSEPLLQKLTPPEPLSGCNQYTSLNVNQDGYDFIFYTSRASFRL